MGTPASDEAAVALIRSAKRSLRRSLLAARRGREKDVLVADALLAVAEVGAAGVVAAYSALPGEPDVGPALATLRARGVRVLLPRVLEAGDLEFREASQDAPPVGLEEADVVVVPALAADRSGHRLGRGGGSYDRALRRVRPGALVLVVVHAEELLPEIPVEAHDVRVAALLAGDELVRVHDWWSRKSQS